MLASPMLPVAFVVVRYVSLVILAVTIVVEVTAFLNCVTRRAEAFPVVGKLTKAIWVLMTGGAVAFTVLSGYATIASSTGYLGPLTSFVAVIVLAVSMVYLVDVRPALREVTEGRGNW